jgi:hypothetical protein
VEPVEPEPEEQVDAEYHRERPEAEHVVVAAGPGEQTVDGVREEELNRHEREERVHERHVPSPVQEDAALGARLHPMLLARRELDAERAAGAPRRGVEDGTPDEQRRAGTEERSHERRVAARPGGERGDRDA